MRIRELVIEIFIFFKKCVVQHLLFFAKLRKIPLSLALIIRDFDAYGDRSVQIGSLSATLNNTHVVADSTPLCVLSKANKGTIDMVRTMLPQGGIDVENGSALRIIIEEKLFEPFEHDDERLMLDDTCEALDYFSLTAEGKPKNISTNGYTAKFYMEYDK